MSSTEFSNPCSRKFRSPGPTHRSPRSPTRTSTTSSTTEALRDELHQLHGPGDQLQDRLLRAWPLREDDEPAIHLRTDEPRGKGEDDQPCDGDRTHAVLRLSAAVARRDPR